MELWPSQWTRRPQRRLSAAAAATLMWAPLALTLFAQGASAIPDGWGPAQSIDEPTFGEAALPRVASDASGNAIAVWQQYNGVFTSIFASRFTRAGGWEAPVLIGGNGSGDAQWAHIAMNSNGSAFVIWSQANGSMVYDMWSARFTSSDGWDPPTQVVSSQTIQAITLSGGSQVFVDGEGNAIATWAQSDGTNQTAWAKRYTPAFGWGLATLLSPFNFTINTWPMIAGDAAGNATVVWEGLTTGNFVFSTHYSPTTGWSAALPIDLNDTVSGYTALSAGEGGRLALVRASIDLWAYVYSPGTGWGPRTTIFQGGAGNLSRQPEVAMDENGNATAVWLVDNGSTYREWTARYDASSSTWSSMPLEPQSSAVPWSTETHVGVGPNGTAFAVWSGSDGTNWTLRGSRYVPGPGWSNFAVLNATLGNPGSSSWISVDPEGNVFAVWEDASGALINIGSRRFSAQDTVPPTLSLTGPADGLVTSNSTLLVAGTTEPGAAVSAGGANGTADEFGAFSLFVDLQPGANNLTVVARDEGGNTATSSVNITYLPPTPPAVALVAPLNNSVVAAGALLMFTVIDNAGIEAVTWDDGTGARVMASPYVVDTSTWPDGPVDMVVTARNLGGATTTLRAHLTIDSSAPSISLASPVDGSIVRPGTPLQFAVNDPYLTSVRWIEGAVDLPSPFQLETTNWADGLATVTLEATDAAGNQVLQSFHVAIDGTPPTLALQSPANRSAFSPGELVRFAVEDNSLQSVEWSNGTGFQALSPPYAVNTTGWDIGDANISLRATDQAGWTASATFRFHLVPPAPDSAPPPDPGAGTGAGSTPPATGGGPPFGFQDAPVEAGLAASIIVVLGLAVTMSSRGAEAFSAAVLLPLFSRLKPDEVRNQVSRGRIIQFVSDNPGASFSQVRRAAELSGAACVYHLRVLERAGEVHRIVDGAAVRFYRPGQRRDREALPALSYTARQVLGVVIELGRPSRGQIALAMADAGQAIGDKNLSYHLKVLVREKGLLESSRLEGHAVYYANPADLERIRQRLEQEARVDRAMAQMTGAAPTVRPQGETEGPEPNANGMEAVSSRTPGQGD